MEHTHASPWLAQLAHERPDFVLEKDAETDVAIVGAGIAGISTAYYILTKTSKRVVLIDARRVAHGATGHNAGQVVSYFERPLSELVEEFGLEKTIRAQKDIDDAWFLLEDIVQSCNLQTPLSRCTGHAGLSTIDQIIKHLTQMHIRHAGGLKIQPMMVSVDSAITSQIPKEFDHLYVPMPHSKVMDILSTDDPGFIAALSEPKGCMNSAMFCEELLGYLCAIFGDRISVAENLPVEKAVLEKNRGLLHTHGPTICAQRIVLCTNGFETLTVENQHGEDIDTSLHANLEGMIGYMAGYLDMPETTTSAISYFREQKSHTDPYMYLTRRAFEVQGKNGSLVCIGGPERPLPDNATYDPHATFPADIEEELDRSLRLTYKNKDPQPKRSFAWHGLMGFTPNGVRRVGAEPRNPVLLYNIGCNGVGILPSVYGGQRIAHIVAGKKLAPSIFDPVE